MEKIDKYENIVNNYNNLVSFTRYLYRVDKIRILFEKEYSKKNGNYIEIVFIFHSLLYVCIESYKEFKFSDFIIDHLLNENYKEQIYILRQMRNSIFHPEKKLCDNRQKEYIESSNILLNWSTILLSEFNRFVYYFAEDNNALEFGTILRRSIKKQTSWLPYYGIGIKHYKSIKKIRLSYHHMINNNKSKKIEYENECKLEIRKMNEIFIELYKELLL